MHETGIEGYYALKDGKKLRFGFTTGTCAAAAAKAATQMLIRGRDVETVDILTPKGIALNLELEDIRREAGRVSCAVRKFSGDDPDVTNGVLVYAEVCWRKEPGVEVDGGTGVGRVTKPGLKQRIGEAAINPVPMQMIRSEVERVMDDCGIAEGLRVVISIPAGVELAKKTFNPRLGIEGGISVLGTSGIVEPMSEDALIDSIVLEIKQRKALGDTLLILTPGNYGADFLNDVYGVSDERVVKCSNYIGKALDAAIDAGFERVLLVGHIGKFVKLSGGIMNTHSKEGDCRAELMAAAALKAGAAADTARSLLDCVTTDEMLRILEARGLLQGTLDVLNARIDFALHARVKEQIACGVIVFTGGNRELLETETARQWTREGL
jgi:cobalt-precorrin-5B (C1)-methyltransferase